MSDHLVQFEDVYLAFGENRVFEGLNLRVRRGEILTLIGGSGCGKSVLLKMVIGLVSWQRGTVTVGGRTLSAGAVGDLQPIRRSVGMVFQGGALFDSLDVYENIVYALRERGISDERHLDARVAEVLEMVGLPEVARKFPAELSGGMRKRVALARAVAEEPELLLYDEPTTGLDPVNVRRISELIVSLRARLGITALVVTHDLPSAFMISDRIAMVAHRRVVAIDTGPGLLRSQDPEVRSFLRAMPLPAERAAGEAV